MGIFRPEAAPVVCLCVLPTSWGGGGGVVVLLLLTAFISPNEVCGGGVVGLTFFAQQIGLGGGVISP